MRIRMIIAGSAATLLTVSGAQAATVTQTFGVQNGFGNGPDSLVFALTGLDPAVNSALNIDFSFIGDLNSSFENFTLSIDGTNYGTGCDNNTANGVFGNASDQCSQDFNSLTTASLIVSATDAVGLLADGALDIVFAYSAGVNNNLVSLFPGQTASGVFFSPVLGTNFSAGGTISYTTDDPAPIPVPPALPMLAAGLLAQGFLRRDSLGSLT